MSQKLGEKLKSRDKPKKPIEMVAVQMRYEDMLNARKLSIGIAQSYLGSLSTVDEEEVSAHFEQLS